MAAADYRLSATPVDWTELVGAPLTLGTMPCNEGEFLAYDSANTTWICAAPGAEADPLFSTSDVAGVTTADIANWDSAFGWGDHTALGYLTAEVDGSVTNEINTALALSGSDLQVTDSGGTLTVDLSGLGYLTTEVDGSVTNEINTALALSGSTLQVTDSGGTLTIDLSGTFATTSAANSNYVNVTGDTMTGNLEVDARLRLEPGDSTSAGIDFDPNPGGGSGDYARIRYFATTGEATRFELSVGNDADDVIALEADGQDVLVVSSQEIAFDGALVMGGCPSGFVFRTGICTRFDAAWGLQTWTDAQETCHGESARICTYRDVLLSWGSSTNHPQSLNGDWLGDFVADDTVLDVNNYSNKSNFEGTVDKGNSHEFVCCITPL